MGGGGGGAWKVAYADFVTAMMALFMVLWISSQDEKILIATSKYFQSPFSSPMNATSGVMPFNSNKTTQSSGEESGAGAADKSSQIATTFLNTVAAEFYRLLHVDQSLEGKPIDVQVTADGLHITLYDRTSKPLFERDSAEFTEWGKFVMQNMAWTVDRHGFTVTVDGHTRANLKEIRPNYGSWELSSDRALAARRALEHYAVDPKLFERVTGYGDLRPLPDLPPDSESNQRVTINLTLTSRPKPRDIKPSAKPAAAIAPGHEKPSS